MLIVCCKCGKFMGEKEPYSDVRKTHSYCEPCKEEALEEMRKYIEARGKLPIEVPDAV